MGADRTSSFERAGQGWGLLHTNEVALALLPFSQVDESVLAFRQKVRGSDRQPVFGFHQIGQLREVNVKGRGPHRLPGIICSSARFHPAGPGSLVSIASGRAVLSIADSGDWITT